jgi:formate hydrogenlyase subunit 3/multisubunit Na+/H+ antiporter MnhD subunit
MSELILIAAWRLPLALIPLLLMRLQGLLALAALPALIAATILPPGTDLELPWLLLSSQFGLDTPDRIFLMFSALIWLVAGAQAELTMREQPCFRRFGVFFLMAMSGNFWLILGQDMVNFYLGFSLMGFAAYGLIIHNRNPDVLRAGRIYLVMTLFAEVALLSAFMMIFMHTQDRAPTPGQIAGVSDWAIAFLLLSLGIKAGFLFLHMWLPLSYTAAPAPAAAVLSGAMSKVALLGWIRYLPLGEVMFWDWGMLLVILGSLATFYAIVAGLLQTNPKTILAYSSISKMGLMGIVLGLAMMQPDLSEYVITAMVFFAAYHGITKAALFMGTGLMHEISSRWVFITLVFPSLIMMGAPLTAGAMQKTLIKPMIEGFDGYWASFIPELLVIATIGTTLMMLRFLFMIYPGQNDQPSSASRIALPWIMLTASALLFPFMFPYPFTPVSDSWPLIVAAFIAIVMLRFCPQFLHTFIGRIPPGDIIAVFSHIYRPIHYLYHFSTSAYEKLTRQKSSTNTNQPRDGKSMIISGVEKSLSTWQISGILLMVLGIALFFTLWLAR